MRRYTIEELANAETYAQDKDLDLLVRKVAKATPAEQRPTTYSNMKDPWKGFRDGMLAGRHPEAVKAAVDGLMAAADAELAVEAKAPAILVKTTLPVDWTGRVEGREIILAGPYEADLVARLGRVGEWDRDAKVWRIPAAKAASLKRIFANFFAAAEKAYAAQVAEREAKRAAWAADATRREAEARAKAEAEAKARAERDAQQAKERAEQYARRAKEQPAAPKKAVQRVLFAVSDGPAFGVALRWRGRAVVFTGAGEKFRIDESHPSAWGSHLLGHEGERGAYYYYRDATAEEVAALEQAEAQAIAQRQAEQARADEARAIRETIQQQGERPETVPAAPQGEMVPVSGSGNRIYGSGEWVIIEPNTQSPRSIWWVQGNGADGDAWSNNNLPGSIGWRVPWTPELEARIRTVKEVQ